MNDYSMALYSHHRGERYSRLKVTSKPADGQWVRNGWCESPRAVAHRAETIYSTRLGDGVVAICGALLTVPVEADIETVPDICEQCCFACDHYLYTFRDRDGNALYVGQTSNPLTRMQKHRGSSPWWFWAATAEAVVVDPADALRIERETIMRLDPAYNKLPRRRSA